MLFLFFRVIGHEFRCAIQPIIRHIISRIYPVITMDAAIKTSRNSGKQIRFRQRTVQALQVIIQTRSNLKMYPAFISEKPCLHINQIVLCRLFISFDVSLQLKLLRFQKITRIIFVWNSKRAIFISIRRSIKSPSLPLPTFSIHCLVYGHSNLLHVLHAAQSK